MQDAVNGNLFFSNRMTDFVSRSKVSLPSASEAERIAVDFLKEMAMLPDDFEKSAKLLHVGGMFSADLQSGRATGKVQKLITLHFGREINGVSVQGPGSKIIVEIGDGGNIVTFNKKWNPTMLKLELIQPISPIRPTERIMPGIRPTEGRTGTGKEDSKQASSAFYTPDEMKELIQKTLQSEWTTADLIKINNVKLVYYDRSGSFIQPAYAIEAVITVGEEKFNYLHHISALRQPPEAIYPEVYTEAPRAIEKKQEPKPSEVPSE
jgi:hypothetical protein